MIARRLTNALATTVILLFAAVANAADTSPLPALVAANPAVDNSAAILAYILAAERIPCGLTSSIPRPTNDN